MVRLELLKSESGYHTDEWTQFINKNQFDLWSEATSYIFRKYGNKVIIEQWYIEFVDQETMIQFRLAEF